MQNKVAVSCYSQWFFATQNKQKHFTDTHKSWDVNNNICAKQSTLDSTHPPLVFIQLLPNNPISWFRAKYALRPKLFRLNCLLFGPTQLR